MDEPKTLSLDYVQFLVAFSQANQAQSRKMALEIDERDMQLVVDWAKTLDEMKVQAFKYIENLTTLGLDAPGITQIAEQIHRITGEMYKISEFKLKLIRGSIRELNKEIPQLNSEVKAMMSKFGQPKKIEDVLKEE